MAPEIAPLLPLGNPPPPSFPLPQLTLRSPQSLDLIPGWTLSTHAFPAAYPRTHEREARKIQGGEDPSILFWKVSEDTKGQLTDLFPLVDGARERTADEVGTQDEEGLWMCANRYWDEKLDEQTRRNGLTLVFGHANGLHKETWEPTIAEILKALRSQNSGTIISEIWCLDTVQQGDSGLLNEGRLGDIFDWYDSGRDLAQFLLRYLPFNDRRPSSSDTFLLPCLDDTIIDLNSNPIPKSFLPYRGRKIVGVGHSLGGYLTGLAASICPNVFSQIILVDPVGNPGIRSREEHVAQASNGALRRKDFWVDFEDAKKNFLSKPFFAAWDSRVLDLYLRYALVPAERDGKKGLRLKCRREQEAAVFAERYKRSVAGFQRTTTIPPTLPLHIHFADIGKCAQPETDVDLTKKVVSHATWTRAKPGVGHLAVQEDPTGTGNVIASLLVKFSNNNRKGKL